MKKILLLLIVATAITAAMAQRMEKKSDSRLVSSSKNELKDSCKGQPDGTPCKHPDGTKFLGYSKGNCRHGACLGLN